MAKPNPKQQLAMKEAKLFKELLRDYEERAYKRGLKTADTILKKSPEHGETICMKGIVTYNMGKKTEGLDLVKKGTGLNPASHICWHVSALVARAERNLERALACYTQAVKIDKDQIALVRDLVTIQTQLRRLPDILEHRLHLLSVQPRLRTNWIAMAVAYHLNKRYDEALEVLDRFEAMQVQIPPKDFEMSELVLYHAMVLEESGNVDGALAYLDQQGKHVVDRMGYASARGQLMLASGQHKSAEGVFRALLEEYNAESYEFINNFLKSKGSSIDAATAENRATALEALTQLESQIPKSLAVRRLVLHLAQGDLFRKRAHTYLVEFLVKGVPSLFNDLKSLYQDKDKQQTIQDIVEGFRTHFEQHKTIDPSAEEGQDAPSTLVWILYYLAQHYSFLGDHQTALGHINLVLQHTPSLPDLHMMHARLLKRAGDERAAEKAMREARELDAQDRFLNGKSVKYLLRIDQVSEAEKVAGLFTRSDAASPLSDLTDMQALWFLQEEAGAYTRLGNTGMALKRYHQLLKTFADYRDDEYDFHAWCMRKSTLRSYIKLIRFDDQLYAHPAFFKAAQGACQMYLELAAKQPAVSASGAAPNAEEEEKKAAKKAKKSQAKGKPTNTKGAATATAKNADDEPMKIVDEDPKGEKLAATATPLEEARKFVEPLERQAASRIETWLLSFDVAFAGRKYVQAIKALRNAHQIAPSSPDTYCRSAQLFRVLSSRQNTASEAIQALYKEIKETVFPYDSLDAGNAELLKNHSENPATYLALARLSKPEQQADHFMKLLDGTCATDLQTATKAFKQLQSSNGPIAAEFQAKAAERFPYAAVFKVNPEVETNGAGEKEELNP